MSTAVIRIGPLWICININTWPWQAENPWPALNLGLQTVFHKIGLYNYPFIWERKRTGIETEHRRSVWICCASAFVQVACFICFQPCPDMAPMLSIKNYSILILICSWHLYEFFFKREHVSLTYQSVDIWKRSFWKNLLYNGIYTFMLLNAYWIYVLYVVYPNTLI